MEEIEVLKNSNQQFVSESDVELLYNNGLKFVIVQFVCIFTRTNNFSQLIFFLRTEKQIYKVSKKLNGGLKFNLCSHM